MVSPRFLDDYGYWDDFVKECFYEKRAKDYLSHIRYNKRNYPYEDVKWFKIVRYRYSWEWWKDYISVEFTGAMMFMKDAKGFQYLDHVIPLLIIDGKCAQGKIIHASGIEIMDDISEI